MSDTAQAGLAVAFRRRHGRDTRPGDGRLAGNVTENTSSGVLTTGMGRSKPKAAAPHLGALDVNVNAIPSYAACTIFQ